MAKRKRSRRKAKKKISIATVAGATAAPLAIWRGTGETSGMDSGGAEQGLQNAIMVYTGISTNPNLPRFKVGRMMHGTVPLVAGALVSKLATKFGLNRMISNIPYIKI